MIGYCQKAMIAAETADRLASRGAILIPGINVIWIMNIWMQSGCEMNGNASCRREGKKKAGQKKKSHRGESRVCVVRLRPDWLDKKRGEIHFSYKNKLFRFISCSFVYRWGRKCSFYVGLHSLSVEAKNATISNHRTIIPREYVVRFLFALTKDK